MCKVGNVRNTHVMDCHVLDAYPRKYSVTLSTGMDRNAPEWTEMELYVAHVVFPFWKVFSVSVYQS